MKAIKILLIIVICSQFCGSDLFADGLITSSDSKYPSICLKNKSTEVTVLINGIIAETIVKQEFQNEWDKAVDGVYSFPLPADARTTRLLYSYGDTMIDAVLKIQQQSTNPGTGEGGVIAEINKYMGSNAVRIRLSEIPAGGTKIVELHYISLLNQFNGHREYRYPLNTSDFLKTPLDYLEINFIVSSSQKIVNYNLESHSGAQIVKSTDTKLELKYSQSKAFAAKDILFNYTAGNNLYNIDLYSWKPDTEDGYFTLVGYSQIEAGDTVLPGNYIFLVGNSSSMLGNKLNQSKIALSLCLDKLRAKDSFNIVSRGSIWETVLVPATPENILSAKTYINTYIKAEYGSDLGYSLNYSIEQLKNRKGISSVLVFSDGRGLFDPYEIEERNVDKTGIFFIAIGNDIDRARLETVSALNYGFVTYINEDNILGAEILEVFDKINRPLLKDVSINYDQAGIHSLYPQKTTAVYAGSALIQTGRYSNPGYAFISLRGYGISDTLVMNFQEDFSANTSTNELARQLWAKYAIDQLEAKILIVGEDKALKDSLISLSLANNMRCRYTAYLEDTAYIGDPEDLTGTVNTSSDYDLSRIICNYPNPFSYSSVLKIYISNADIHKAKFIRIYDLYGRLIYVVDISGFSQGVHELTIGPGLSDGLVNGIYLVVMELDLKAVSKIKICVN